MRARIPTVSCLTGRSPTEGPPDLSPLTPSSPAQRRHQATSPFAGAVCDVTPFYQFRLVQPSLLSANPRRAGTARGVRCARDGRNERGRRSVLLHCGVPPQDCCASPSDGLSVSVAQSAPVSPTRGSPQCVSVPDTKMTVTFPSSPRVATPRIQDRARSVDRPVDAT